MDILERLLAGDNDDIDELLLMYNIKTTIASTLPSKVYGLTYVSRLQNYHIILNGNLNLELQQKTFMHEINHIVNHLPKASYILTLNNMDHEMERELINC